ncbi:MAG: xanthine dehydrogenase molybdopterin binding subunit [Candidatus Omnitrophota bacterium]
MKHPELHWHVKGQSVFLDDIRQPEDLLYAAVFSSPKAHGKILRLDVENAKAEPGVVEVLTWQSIPGENQIGGIIPDEPLLAEGHVHFVGQPLALVVAESKAMARQAFGAIDLDIEFLPVITDPREAFRRGKLMVPPRTFVLGDVERAWDRCATIVEGRVDSGSQEHFYMETQGAMAIPTEGGGIKIHSSTQSPTAVQRTAARILKLPMRMVEVEVQRLGGGFGGKEDQATGWACLAALAAFKLKRAVKLVLDRHEDIRLTGKRHPYSSDFKLGLAADGSILAYEVMFYQNAGAAADLSTAILERTLFHCTNTYFIPNVKATAACCRTNLPPFTAFRGFGGPQAMVVIEAAIHQAARAMHLQPSFIQRKNLLKDGDTFPYGQVVENSRAVACWIEAEQYFQFKKVFATIDAFNAESKLKKKGAAVMPICFGISFTNTALNQAGALVHVYSDGSVGISTAAVEMGQGVNMKMAVVAAQTFGISSSRIKIESTNTTRVANTSPTAASSAADLNGKAVEIACLQIQERLIAVAAAQLNQAPIEHITIGNEAFLLKGHPTGLTWEKVVNDALGMRINLSAQGFYATPDIYFDRTREKGHPFAYHVFGTALVEVTLDCLRGTYTVDAVHVAHDGGKSIDPLIDRGQVEGGIVQGIGWVTMEEILYGKDGRLMTDSAGKYKIPDIKSVPGTVDIRFLGNAENPRAVMRSKAVGEPPLMYGLGAYFALIQAMNAFRPDKEAVFDSPLTPEKVLGYLYDVK